MTEFTTVNYRETAALPLEMGTLLHAPVTSSLPGVDIFLGILYRCCETDLLSWLLMRSCCSGMICCCDVGRFPGYSTGYTVAQCQDASVSQGVTLLPVCFLLLMSSQPSCALNLNL
jgi:hypothetical protein